MTTEEQRERHNAIRMNMALCEDLSSREDFKESLRCIKRASGHLLAIALANESKVGTRFSLYGRAELGIKSVEEPSN
jgi:hypothetical protein